MIAFCYSTSHVSYKRLKRYWWEKNTVTSRYSSDVSKLFYNSKFFCSSLYHRACLPCRKLKFLFRIILLGKSWPLRGYDRAAARICENKMLIFFLNFFKRVRTHQMRFSCVYKTRSDASDTRVQMHQMLHFSCVQCVSFSSFQTRFKSV